MKKFLFLLFCAAQPCAAQSIDTLALRAHTRFLASDALEGRGTGTRGEHVAALYIAAELMRMGLRPAVGSDYLTPLPLKRVLIDNQTTTITYHGTEFRSGRDFVWNTGGRDAFRDFSGPLLYVGTADSVAVRRVREARGHIVVLAGPMGAAATAYVPALIKAGAAGVVLLIGDAKTFDLYVRSRGGVRYFVDANVSDAVWQPDLPVVLAGPSLARSLLGDSLPERFTELAELQARIGTRVEDVQSANIAAVLPGSDPNLSSRYVAFTAHYDHLGISTPDERGDSIYNGFSDNAAGVAMLLAIADVFRKEQHARSILFLFFTGEERGLLGSSYMAANPPVPLKDIEALINLDAGAPSAPPLDWRIAGGTDSPLGETTKKALAARKWEAQPGAASPNSDYWPFLQRGVPAVFLIPGNRWEHTTEEAQRQLKAKWDRYHQANDEWAPDFPFAGLQRYAEAALAVGRVVANKKPGK